MDDSYGVSLLVINFLMLAGIIATAYGTFVEEDPWSALSLVATVGFFLWMNL